MALQMQNVGVTTAAVKVCTAVPGSTVEFSIATGTSGYVALGLSNSVTTTTGFAISPGIPHQFTLPTSGQAYDIWAIASTGTIQLGIIITTTA